MFPFKHCATYHLPAISLCVRPAISGFQVGTRLKLKSIDTARLDGFACAVPDDYAGCTRVCALFAVLEWVLQRTLKETFFKEF